MDRKPSFVQQHKQNLQRVGAVLLALLVWQVLAMAVGHQLLVPSPLSVLQRLAGIWLEEGFWSTVWFTFRKIVAGFLLRNVGYWTLFPYAAFFVAMSFVTMLFVKHGDSKIIEKKGLEAFDVED